jgi:hypothetical protein
MTKYIVKARAGINQPESEPLEWSEEQYKNFLAGDSDLESEVRGMAHQIVSMDYWVEEVKTDL